MTQARLAAGVYRGTITGTFSVGGPQEVGVLLIVTPPGSALQTQAGLPGAAQCVPSGLQLLATTIGNGLSLPVSFPRVLVALTVDTCGTVLSDATVLASIEGLNISLRSLGDGFHSGTWVPVSEAAQVTITFAALHPTFAQVQRSFTVSTAAAPGRGEFAGGVSPTEWWKELASPRDAHCLPAASFPCLASASPRRTVSLPSYRWSGNWPR